MAKTRKAAWPEDAVEFGGHHYKVFNIQGGWNQARDAYAGPEKAQILLSFSSP